MLWWKHKKLMGMIEGFLIVTFFLNVINLQLINISKHQFDSQFSNEASKNVAFTDFNSLCHFILIRQTLPWGEKGMTVQTSFYSTSHGEVGNECLQREIPHFLISFSTSHFVYSSSRADTVIISDQNQSSIFCWCFWCMRDSVSPHHQSKKTSNLLRISLCLAHVC